MGKNLRNKELSFKIFKGNILNEFSDIKKGDGTPFKVFTPFWRNAEKFYFDKIPSSDGKILKCKVKTSYFKNTLKEKEIFPEKKWFKKFEKILASK